MTTICISSQHVAAINPFCLGLWVRSKQPMGQEKSSPGLMLGIKAEIWFKCLLIVFCLLTFPNLHCVLLLREKIVTKIKLSGKVLLLFQCQSHGTCGNAVPGRNQSRSVRYFSSYAGSTLWKEKMSCSPSVNLKNRLLGFMFSSLFDLSSLRECWFCNCSVCNHTERQDWSRQFDSLLMQLVPCFSFRPGQNEVGTDPGNWIRNNLFFVINFVACFVNWYHSLRNNTLQGGKPAFLPSYALTQLKVTNSCETRAPSCVFTFQELESKAHLYFSMRTLFK